MKIKQQQNIEIDIDLKSLPVSNDAEFVIIGSGYKIFKLGISEKYRIETLKLMTDCTCANWGELQRKLGEILAA